MKRIGKGIATFFVCLIIFAIIATIVFPQNETGSVDIPDWYYNTVTIASIVVAVALNIKRKPNGTTQTVTAKKSHSNGLTLLVVMIILDALMLRMLPSGYGTMSYWCVLLAFILITVYAGIVAYVNVPLQKKLGRYLELYDKQKNAASLDQYFPAHDELINLLLSLQKMEFFIKKKNGLTEKPSKLIEMYKAIEEKQVYDIILQMTVNYKDLVKDTGVEFSNLFDRDIQKYKVRLSADNIRAAENCAIILHEYEVVAGKIEEADHMDGHAFEYWCADLLRKNGFSDVEVTPGSGDQGVDIIATKDGIRYAVQCKCYSSDLSNKPVQEVHTGKSIYHCQVGAVMTNRYFTASAKQAAEATGTLLWNRDKLIEMLEK